MFPWLPLGAILTVLGLTPVAWCVLRRLEEQRRLAQVLGILWLLIGVPTLIGVPLAMLHSMSTGAYDPVRDDFMTAEAAALVRPRLLSAIRWGLTTSLCVGLVVMLDNLVQRCSRPMRTKPEGE